MPGQQRDTGLQRPGVPEGLAASPRGAPVDQQFSGVHRTCLPGPVRGGLHTEYQQRSGRNQVDRTSDRRSGLDRRVDRARAGCAQDRARRRRGRQRSGGPCVRAAARPRGPRGHRVRKERSDRRTAALRDTGLQDGKIAHRSARAADGGRGCRVPHRGAGGGPCRRGGRARPRSHLPRKGKHNGRRADRRIRCDRAGRWGRGAA